MKKYICPFSNGTEAIVWYSHNCESCTRAYFPKDDNWPKDSTIKQYISCGKECKLKYHIDMGFISSKIPENIARQIGWSEEKGFPDTCLMFSDKDDYRYSPPKRPAPDNTPPNQLLMPFYLQEIGIREIRKKEAVNP